MRDFRHLLRGLARRIPLRFRDYVKRSLTPQFVLSYVERDGPVQRLQRAMQAGFGKSAVNRLEQLKPELTSYDLADAAWAIAYWSRLNGDNSRALDYLLIRSSTDPHVLWDPRHTVLEVDALLKLGRVESARAAVEQAIERLGEVPELCFCAANVAGASPLAADERRLTWLNKPFVAAGLAPIELKDASAPLTIDNVTARASPHPRSGEAKVSVLMPAYNTGEIIGTAIESVLAQTWRNLELIIVDDGSADKTWPVIEAYASRDPRVKPLRHARNRGAYAARNTALSQASGDLVTVHDSDDWSHPEKIARQTVALISGREVANATNKIRLCRDMSVVNRPHGTFLNECYASLMFAREAIVELGGWDESRIAADDEFWKRLLLAHGAKQSILCPTTPLSFYLVRPDSLTNQDATGLATNSFGARRQYTEAYRYWHETERAKANPDLSMRPGVRRFPIPAVCLPGPTKRLEYDVLLVSDFSRPENTARHAALLRLAHDLGLRSACFHWPRLEGAGRDIEPSIRSLLHDGIADSVVAGESLACMLVVVGDAAILDDMPDVMPQVRSEACRIVGERVEARVTNAKSAFAAAAQYARADEVEPMLRALGAHHARGDPSERWTTQSTLAAP